MYQNKVAEGRSLKSGHKLDKYSSNLKIEY